jgi:hypothetical protein
MNVIGLELAFIGGCRLGVMLARSACAAVVREPGAPVTRPATVVTDAEWSKDGLPPGWGLRSRPSGRRTSMFVITRSCEPDAFVTSEPMRDLGRPRLPRARLTAPGTVAITLDRSQQAVDLLASMILNFDYCHRRPAVQRGERPVTPG